MEYFKNENLEIKIVNEILHVKHFAEVLTLEIVKDGIDQRLKLSKGKSYAMLADIRSIRSTSKQVRDFLSSPENSTQLKAGAMIVKNIFQETVGNIFIFINKPIVPAKLFTNEQDALNWLESFKS